MKPVIDKHRMIMKLELLDDETAEYEAELPFNFEVCDRCSGKGTHTNPNIDGHGISSEEWANEWDDESREMYMSGGYDVLCELCHGERVMPVVDESRCDPDVLKHYYNKLQAEYEVRRDEAMERRYCGDY
jgi:hypothetical protein